jgi:hypothetical protein
MSLQVSEAAKAVVKPSSQSQQVWRDAVMGGIKSGKTASIAITEADEVMMAFETRFGPYDENKINATVRLDIALFYTERHALIGRRVVMPMNWDVVPVGVLKDFTPEGFPQIKWETPSDFKTVGITNDRLYLVRPEE